MNNYNLWLNHASTVLGPKEVRQFVNAQASPLTEFHTRVVRPQYFRPDHPENFYLGVSLDETVEGRNHRLAEAMTTSPHDWPAVTYFTNPMTIPPTPEMVWSEKYQREVEKWVSPKERVCFGISQVFTYEFDQKDIAFFKQQLSWMRSSTGKWQDSAMGRLFAHCSQWVDFEGITVAYSGNKSFHIHIVFSTAQAKAMGISNHIRSGLMQHWRRLMKDVMETLDPGVNPDMGMDQPEKFRRLPNGIRVLDKENVLGMPAGTAVPQLTLWEKYRDRAAKGAQTVFFDPNLFTEAYKSVSRTAKQLDFAPSTDELQYCKAKMLEVYSGRNGVWPEFIDFVYQEGQLRAHFANHAADKTPASYMDLEYRTVNINGSNPMGLTPSTSPKLVKPLGEMMVEWIGEYNTIHNRNRTPEEKHFALTVHDSDSAKTAIKNVLLSTIQHNKMSFVCAPEGISKTTSLFDNHQRIHMWLHAAGTPRVMYAFADYESAAEKARDFNLRQAKNGFIGVVLPSFDRAYDDACKALKITPLTLDDAAASNFPNLWDAVSSLQPDVLIEFYERHQKLHQTIGGKQPVFFTVHAVAHRWAFNSPTRLMWAPSFWDQLGRDAEHTKQCRSETSIGLLVHDEVKAESLVASYPKPVVEWANTLIESDDVWKGDAHSTARLVSFDQHVAQNGNPTVNGKSYGMTFEAMQDIYAFHGHEWVEVTTTDHGEYGDNHDDKSIYKAAIGNVWCFMERRWPKDSADRVLILTTETVPLTIARTLGEWTVFDLDTPLIKRDSVVTIPDRKVSGKNLLTLCSGWRLTYPSYFIISNKVKSLTSTMTHARARGSNLLMGQDILQTMTFVTPEEFEQLEAYNAFCGTDYLVRTRHIDEFNQTAGRNLGFRKRGSPKHILMVNKRLFGLLVGEAKARARYDMAVKVNSYERRKGQQTDQQQQRFAKESATDEQKINMAALRAKLLNEGK